MLIRARKRKPSDTLPALLFVLPSMAHGGAQKVFLELVSDLQSKGLPLSLLVLDREGELLEQIPAGVNPIFLSDSAGFGRVRQMLAFRRYCRSHNIGRVYSTITGMNLFVLVALMGLRIQIIIREASTRKNIDSRVKKRLTRWLYPFADFTICTSETVRHEMVTYCHVDPGHARVIPNPIDIQRISTLSELKPVIPEAFMRRKGLCLVAVGRLIPAKGFDLLVRALAEILPRRSVKLIIVGDGPEQSALENLVDELSISEAVYFAGYQSNPFPYIRCSDVFVLSSRWEGYVNVVLEAMVLEKPILFTDCGSGPGELLKNELGQKPVAVESVSALAAGLLDLADNPTAPDYSKLLERHALEQVGEAYLRIPD